MNILKKIKRHAAVATGNFESMFKNTAEIPPLPAATASLMLEINKPNPDFNKLETILSSTPGLTAKIIKTVNSSLYSIRNPITNIQHAISMLGIKRIRELIVAYTVMNSLPVPDSDLFNHEAIWADSLIIALFAKSFANKILPEKADEAFVASLLSDLALPILLTIWEEYYSPILSEWHQSDKRLSEIEREHFKWDHAQAGAWIVKSWNFSDELICYIGSHNLEIDDLKENELSDTIVLPIAISSMIGSCIKSERLNTQPFIDEVIHTLKYTSSELIALVEKIKQDFNGIRNLFNLPEKNANEIFDNIIQTAENKEE